MTFMYSKVVGQLGTRIWKKNSFFDSILIELEILLGSDLRGVLYQNGDFDELTLSWYVGHSACDRTIEVGCLATCTITSDHLQNLVGL